MSSSFYAAGPKGFEDKYYAQVMQVMLKTVNIEPFDTIEECMKDAENIPEPSMFIKITVEVVEVDAPAHAHLKEE